MINLAFLWHMHQPDYRDASGIMQMPWVFLHAIKDYYDMPWMLSRFPGLKATFNITPPLIEQLQLCADAPALHDRFLKLWAREPSELAGAEREWMIKLCKSAPYDTMVRPLPRYAELYVLERYNHAELCDLQVWFILAWCGVYLRTHNETVRTLLTRESFSAEDKRQLLQTLSHFLKTIFPFYTQLQREEVISLSTTPFNHPILPLLLDVNNARIAHPHTVIPDNALGLRDDAIEQIRRAQALFRRTFGIEAHGFWPAEGAVDEASVRLYKEAGLRWIATDEAILFKSLGSEARDALYAPYRFDDVTIGFRDHGLSDLIGFTYRFWEAPRAAQHFTEALRAIDEAGEDQTVFVILDGENAWEFYPDNAFDFFDALYARLAAQTPWCRTVGMDEVAALPSRTLERLAPGSWIHGEFNTWIGHPEKTRGWELIFMTRRDFEKHAATLDDAVREQIRTQFLAAECSDWFWWYGDDHQTPFSAEFDELFRTHLLRIYDLMKVAAPQDLFIPIIREREALKFLLQPQFPISPRIDGRRDSFFEWVGSGVVDERRLFSTMDRVRGPVEKILFGQDGERMYCAFVADAAKMKPVDMLRVSVNAETYLFEIPLEELLHAEVLLYEQDDVQLQVAHGNWLEIALTYPPHADAQLGLRFELEHEGQIVQMLPGYGELKIDLHENYAKHWFV